MLLILSDIAKFVIKVFSAESILIISKEGKESNHKFLQTVQYFLNVINLRKEIITHYKLLFGVNCFLDI